MKDRVKEEGEEETEKSSISWLISQRAAVAEGGWVWSPEPGISVDAGIQALGLPIAFPGLLVGSWVRSTAVTTQISVHVAYPMPQC